MPERRRGYAQAPRGDRRSGDSPRYRGRTGPAGAARRGLPSALRRDAAAGRRVRGAARDAGLRAPGAATAARVARPHPRRSRRGLGRSPDAGNLPACQPECCRGNARAGRSPAGRATAVVAQRRTVRALWGAGAGRVPARLRAGEDRRAAAPPGRAGSDALPLGAALAGVVAHMNVKAGQGSLSVVPVRRTRLIAFLAAIWIVLVLSLGAWWVTLVIRQARRIGELQSL